MNARLSRSLRQPNNVEMGPIGCASHAIDNVRRILANRTRLYPNGTGNDMALVERLRKRAEIRRSIPRGEPDRISDILEEAASEIERLENLIEDRAYDDGGMT